LAAIWRAISSLEKDQAGHKEFAAPISNTSMALGRWEI
jgi:hypothetical protein